MELRHFLRRITGIMKKIRFLLEYIALIILGKALAVLPRRAVLALGRRAGDLIFYCFPVRKKVTLSQLELAFPEKSLQERAAIARQAYQNLAMNSLEHLCLPSLSKDELANIVRMENEEILQASYAKGNGVIFVGGHFGNWEYMGGAISSKGYPLTYVVAGIANPYIDKKVNDHRRKTGIEILSKGRSVKTILQALRKNRAMGMLMDQDAGRNGIFVEYFGRQCSTPRGPALFALKTGAAIIFLSSLRQDDGTLRVLFEEVEVDYKAGASDANIHDIMQRCTKRLEEYVRQYPGQWLWMHRRWKTRPPQETNL